MLITLEHLFFYLFSYFRAGIFCSNPAMSKICPKSISTDTGGSSLTSFEGFIIHLLLTRFTSSSGVSIVA